MLIFYNNEYHFYKSKIYLCSLKEYDTFYEFYKKFAERFELGYDFKNIDIFLWTYGKFLLDA